MPPLRTRFRSNWPKTDHLPVAFKHGLRAQLLEEATMNQRQSGFNISHVATILGGLAVLIILPLLFWSMLSAQTTSDSFQAGAAPASEQEVGHENIADDAAKIAQIGVAGLTSNNVIEAPVIVTYSLVSAEEATLYLTYSFPDEGGTFYGERLLPVVQEQNEAVITIDLPATAAQPDGSLKEEIEFAVELIIGDVSGVLSASGDVNNYAALAHIGTAVLRDDDVTMMDLPVQITYKLTDYDEAAVIVGYRKADSSMPLTMQPVPEMVEVIVDKDGNVLATESYMIDEGGNRILMKEPNDKSALPVTLGEGVLDVSISIPAELINEDGSLLDDVDIWVALEVTESSE